jgi:hypothetical protein
VGDVRQRRLIPRLAAVLDHREQQHPDDQDEEEDADGVGEVEQPVDVVERAGQLGQLTVRVDSGGLRRILDVGDLGRVLDQWANTLVLGIGGWGSEGDGQARRRRLVPRVPGAA